MENLQDIVMEHRYVELTGTFKIPNISKKNFLTFSYNVWNGVETTLSGKYTVDLRAIRIVNEGCNNYINITLNNYVIKASININDNTLKFLGDTTIGSIYTHNI